MCSGPCALERIILYFCALYYIWPVPSAAGDDYKCEVKQSAQAGNPEGASERKRVVIDWLMLALGEHEDAAPTKKARTRKCHRVAAYWCTVQLDNSLRHISGLARYKRAKSIDERPASPLSWPLLIINPDSGPDGWCAMTYLDRVENLNIAVYPDPCDGVWNHRPRECLGWVLGGLGMSCGVLRRLGRSWVAWGSLVQSLRFELFHIQI